MDGSFHNVPRRGLAPLDGARDRRGRSLSSWLRTAKYAERFAAERVRGRRSRRDVGRRVITQDLYESGARNTKFLPVVFSDADAAGIPKPLRSFSALPSRTVSDGYAALYRRITGQPEIVPVALGGVRTLTGEQVSVPCHRWTVAVHDHAAARSNLPRLPYGFFGREEELQRSRRRSRRQARTWGALLDGPGGIGKTALAIRAAELTPPGQFRRVIFLSAKSRRADARRRNGRWRIL